MLRCSAMKCWLEFCGINQKTRVKKSIPCSTAKPFRFTEKRSNWLKTCTVDRNFEVVQGKSSDTGVGVPLWGLLAFWDSRISVLLKEIYQTSHR